MIRNCLQALLDIKECPNLDRIFSGPALKPWKCCVFTVWCDLPWKAVGVRGSTADEEEEEACFCPVICMQKTHCIYSFSQLFRTTLQILYEPLGYTALHRTQPGSHIAGTWGIGRASVSASDWWLHWGHQLPLKMWTVRWVLKSGKKSDGWIPRSAEPVFWNLLVFNQRYDLDLLWQSCEWWWKGQPGQEPVLFCRCPCVWVEARCRSRCRSKSIAERGWHQKCSSLGHIGWCELRFGPIIVDEYNWFLMQASFPSSAVLGY